MRFRLLLILLCNVAFAQVSSMEQYLEKISTEYACTFSYDNDLVSGVPFAHDTTASDLNTHLAFLEKNSAFQFTRSEGNLVVIAPKVAGANAKLSIHVGSENSSPISGLRLIAPPEIVKKEEVEGTTVHAYIRYRKGDSIVIYSEFHKPKKMSVEDLMQKPIHHLLLQENPLLANEVVVSGYMTTGVNYKKQSQLIEVDLEKLPALPGQTDGDILNALEALPGISASDGKAGSLNIRGSTADQTYMMYDNIPIYHKGHFFGTISPYNPLSADKVNVNRGAFTADKGGRVGGSIEVLSSANYKDSTSFDFSASTTYAGACLKLPIIKKKLGILMAARTSYPLEYETPKIKSISDFIYQETEVNKARFDDSTQLKRHQNGFNDLNLKIGGQLNANNDWQLSYLGINNNVRIETLDMRRMVATKDYMDLRNHGVNFLYNRKWSNRVKSLLTVTSSVFKQKYFSDETQLPVDTLRFNAMFENKLTDFSSRFETEVKTNSWLTIQSGYEFKDHTVLNQTSSYNLIAKDSLDIERFQIHAGYSNLKINFRRKLYSTLGLRMVYNSYTKQWYPEPRANVSYALSKNITLKTAAGIFNQFLVQISGVSIENVGGIENSNWIMANGKGVPATNSKQVSAGALFAKGSFVFDVEGYYKFVDNISVNNFTNFNSPNRYIHGNTQTLGVDVLLKKQFAKLETWTSYTLSNTTMQYDSVREGERLEWLWNQKHVFDVAALYSIKRFKFSLIWKYHSGLAALPGIRTRMLAGPPTEGVGSNSGPPQPPPPSPPGGKKPLDGEYQDYFPAYHQLDFSAVYDIPSKKKWKSSIGLSITNVYDQKNIYAQGLRFKENPPVVITKYMQRFAPNIQFNLSY